MTLSDFFLNNYVQTTILAIVSAVVATIFATRPRVVWSKAHQSTFRKKVNEGNKALYVYTSEIWVKNLGRAQAKQVEVILNYRPQHYEIWTPRKYIEEILADDRISLTFETLGSRDEFQISMLATDFETPAVIEVRHEAGLAKETEMQTTEKPTNFTMFVVAILMLSGFFVILYFVSSVLGSLVFSGLY